MLDKSLHRDKVQLLVTAAELPRSEVNVGTATGGEGKMDQVSSCAQVHAKISKGDFLAGALERRLDAAERLWARRGGSGYLLKFMFFGP